MFKANVKPSLLYCIVLGNYFNSSSYIGHLNE